MFSRRCKKQVFNSFPVIRKKEFTCKTEETRVRTKLQYVNESRAPVAQTIRTRPILTKRLGFIGVRFRRRHHAQKISSSPVWRWYSSENTVSFGFPRRKHPAAARDDYCDCYVWKNVPSSAAIRRSWRRESFIRSHERSPPQAVRHVRPTRRALAFPEDVRVQKRAGNKWIYRYSSDRLIRNHEVPRRTEAFCEQTSSRQI